MSNFLDDRHALYVGWVMGIAVKNGLDVATVLDEQGNYTDRFVVNMGDNIDVTLIVPYPPSDWSLI